MSVKTACCLVVVLVVGVFEGGCATPKYTSLKEAYAGHFLIGTAADPGNYSTTERENIKANYNIITPENCMKPGPIHPSEGTYNWTQPDTLVKWCEDNHIQVWGHNLCWHTQTNGWFFQGAGGGTVSREVLLARFEAHIKTVVGRYKGRIRGWDVVNEAINDGGPGPGGAGRGPTENLRASNWEQIIGPEYLTLAFKWAHEADPNAELYYNDYNIESGAKHASSMVLLKRLIAEGAPITGVGIQGHWDSNPNIAQIERAIRDYKSLGLKVSITELDVTLTGTNSGAFPGAGGFGGFGRGGAGTRPASAPATATAPATTRAAASAPASAPATRGGSTLSPLQRQAQAYAKLFTLFNKYSGTIERVTLWGINDTRSWKSGQRPLLFDGQMQAKPAFQTILDTAAHDHSAWF